MKLFRSSIYCIVAGQAPEWADPAQNKGFVQVTSAPIPPEVTGTADAWHVIHCAPGTEPPDNCAAVVVKGHETPWPAEAVALGWPNGHLYVMEAAWPETGPLGTYPRRGKIIDMPEGATPIETLLVPHEWAGDGA